MSASGDEYCQRARDDADATADVDLSSVSSVSSTIDGFGRAAAAARALADAAPAELRDEHEAMAAAAEDLVAGLRAHDPATLAEFEEASATIVGELETKYGSLDQEVAAVVAHVEDVCGFDPETG